MTPEMWKAIFLAEQAVNESWRNHNLSEETAKTFSQFIQKCARQVKVHLKCESVYLLLETKIIILKLMF